MGTSIKDYWTRKTKTALVLGVVATIFCAIFWFYVWPGQLYALAIGMFVFLFLALFNIRGIGCGLLVGSALFIMFVFSENGASSTGPVAIAIVVVATVEKLISHIGKTTTYREFK